MKDIQNNHDDRRIPIKKAGIKHLRYPIVVLDRKNKSQHTVADLNMYVDLPHNFKGTHMSRFVEIINSFQGKVSVHKLDHLLKEMIQKFDSEIAHLEIKFPYFLEKTAPVSGSVSQMKYDCALTAALDATKKDGNKGIDLIMEVAVPVTTLCPCSKEISDKGAHNQRSVVTIKCRTNALVWLEELIEVAESEASSPIYPLLKREDEKKVTEMAYDNPRFAEDIVRGIAVKLKKDSRITWFEVETENFESIHDHNAYAQVVSGFAEE